MDGFKETSHPILLICLMTIFVIFYATGSSAQTAPGEQANLQNRVTQDQIINGELSLREIRAAGIRVFTTPFNKIDGYGDGPMDLNDTVSPGGRPTLQGNGTLLRVNGLDGQTCLECHSLISAATSPPRLGIGGVGGSVTNAMIMPTAIDPADLEDLDSNAGFNGRFVNPPFVFGSGGVELLGLEMTEDLQQLRAEALAHPGMDIPLLTHGVDFGTIVADTGGVIDYDNVTGVDADLVIKPFGRKGEFATVRDFDREAMQFHFGMQPSEVVGTGNDADADGVFDEILPGDLSALHTFEVTLERPEAEKGVAGAASGLQRFKQIGCASCHVPVMQTRGHLLPLRFPSDPIDHTTGVYLTVDLTQPPVSFEPNDTGGISVPLFADLKRHQMGPDLAESFALGDRNPEFTTARLWGVADTAPYLHDGRATTLTEAILLHGGEALSAREAFAALSDQQRAKVIDFLRSLRTPAEPAKDLLN
ncbi:MAG: di-heme oxidoredictase family protein [Anaerolineales bacterium]